MPFSNIRYEIKGKGLTRIANYPAFDIITFLVQLMKNQLHQKEKSFPFWIHGFF